MQTTACPCGLGAPLDACCGLLLQGAEKAKTAEALMRARYTAYVVGNMDFVFSTHDPETRKEIDRENSERWSKESTWHSLEILSREKGCAGDDEGRVEFVANFSVKGTPQKHHELALFRKREGEWFFVDGEMVKPQPIRRTEAKIGRNDPCNCGSGMKFKRCCGA